MASTVPIGPGRPWLSRIPLPPPPAHGVVQRGGAGMALLCSTSGSTQDWLSLLHTGAEVLQGTGGGSCESWDGGQAPDKASLEAIAAEWEDR